MPNKALDSKLDASSFDRAKSRKTLVLNARRLRRAEKSPDQGEEAPGYRSVSSAGRGSVDGTRPKVELWGLPACCCSLRSCHSKMRLVRLTEQDLTNMAALNCRKSSCRSAEVRYDLIWPIQSEGGRGSRDSSWSASEVLSRRNAWHNPFGQKTRKYQEKPRN